jgi:hypothetical protein
MYRRDLERVANRIRIGKRYTLPRHWIKDCDVPFLKIVNGDIRMRCVEKHEHYAVFETISGVKVCFRYYDLASLMYMDAVTYNRKSGEAKSEASLIF